MVNPMKLFLIEGLPGSGKTTAAAYLCDIFNKSGVESVWYLEESRDHPVHPQAVKQFNKDPIFPKICLEGWREFVSTARDSPILHIMEGSAFLSTVRFMMANELDGISEYFKQFAKIIAPLSPAFLYLRPKSALDLSRIISQIRGHDWATKVADYISNTKYAIRYNLKGLEGMHLFMARYAELCDSLLSVWEGPKKIIRFESGNWDSHNTEIQSFVNDDIIPAFFSRYIPKHAS